MDGDWILHYVQNDRVVILSVTKDIGILRLCLRMTIKPYFRITIKPYFRITKRSSCLPASGGSVTKDLFNRIQVLPCRIMGIY